MARQVALRTALIWRDEVMSDVVADVPKKITIGHKGKPTFVVPDVGVPAGFAILTPGNRGYLLTLGEHMRGTICIDGREQDVSDFVARGDGAAGPGGFRATPITGRDWGVVDLDESGDYKLFFQFVTVDPPLHSFVDMYVMLTLALGAAFAFYYGVIGAFGSLAAWNADPSLETGLAIGVVGSLVSLLVATAVSDPETPRLRVLFRAGLGAAAIIAIVMLMLAEEAIGIELFAWLMVGALTIIIGIVGFSLCWSLVLGDPEQQASTGFSVLLHGALLLGAIIIYRHRPDPNVWPGDPELTGSYISTRIEVEPPKEEKKQPVVAAKAQDAAQQQPKKAKPTATKNPEGASGGKGEKERARDPNAKDVPPDPPKVAFFEDKNRKVLDNIIDRNLSTNLGKFSGIKGDTLRAGSIGFGPGSGTGVGPGKGTGTTRGSKKGGSGGGGNVDGDFVSNKGPIDTGKERAGGNCVGPNCKGTGPKPVSVSVGSMQGDPGGYTEDEINRVVKAAAGRFRACYQKELNRSPGIGGKIVVRFKIGPDGSVKSASPSNASTLSNDAVQSCVARNVQMLRFPPKGAIANVTYPFLFSPGG